MKFMMNGRIHPGDLSLKSIGLSSCGWGKTMTAQLFEGLVSIEWFMVYQKNLSCVRDPLTHCVRAFVFYLCVLMCLFFNYIADS